MSSNGFSIDAALPYNEGKQAAVCGWCIKNPKFFSQCEKSVRPNWFANTNTGKVYGALIALYNSLHRLPSREELEQYGPFSKEDARTQKKILEAIADCLAKTSIYGLDLIGTEMSAWMHSVIFSQGIRKAVDVYNDNRLNEAWEIVEKASLAKATTSFEDGISQEFKPSSERIIEEREHRLKQAGRGLSYGVQFLDDALGDIIPTEVVLIGAPPGKGKTQLSTNIALANAQNGNAVHYFALEAHDFEIERRIKYGIIADQFYRDSNRDKNVHISYQAWCQGRLEDVLGPIESKMEDVLRDKVRNLHTYYKISGKFDLSVLEKRMMEVVGKSKLIIVDHLHYVDTDGSNENLSYKKIVQEIRNIALRFEVPVVVVAHLRKSKDGKSAPLIGSIDDFMGTSDVPKIATTAIVLAPAMNEIQDGVQKPSYMYSTYINVVKSRMEGNRTWWTAVCEFDSRYGRYTGAYRLGKMDYNAQNWEECPPNALPYWAKPTRSVINRGIK